MVLDGTATETAVQPPGSVAGSVVKSSPQAPFIIPFSQPAAEPQVTVESAPAQERSSKEIYAELAARYRELGKKQFEGGLSSGELSEKQRLEEMAGFGLFAENLSEEQLKAKDAAYKSRIEAEAKELVSPQVSAERYRFLGKKLIDYGLMPDELAEYNRLKAYADQGKFELRQAA